MKRLLLGIFIGIPLPLAAGALLIRLGYLPMSTNAPPLPFEKTLARWAVQEEVSKGDTLVSPIPDSPSHVIAGAKIYLNHCAGCHGLPDRPISKFSTQMFPPIPQFFHDGITSDPVGRTYWTTRNGIRLSGMLSFEGILSEEEIWQVAWMLKRTDQLPNEALRTLHP